LRGFLKIIRYASTDFVSRFPRAVFCKGAFCKHSQQRFLQALANEVERHALRPRSVLIAAMPLGRLLRSLSLTRHRSPGRMEKTTRVFVLPAYAVFRRTHFMCANTHKVGTNVD
jgi:hypothetical protein